MGRAWILTLAAPLLAVGLIGLAGSAVWNRQSALIAFACVTASGYHACLWAVLTAIDEAPGRCPRLCWRSLRSRRMRHRAVRGGASAQEMLSRAPLEESTFDPALLDYLVAHTQDVEYLFAVTDAFAGAEYVIATGRPVLYVRGTIGQDAVADEHDLARMVNEGRLRFVLWPEIAPPGAPPDPILEWLTQQCERVQTVDLPDLSTPPFIGGLYPATAGTDRRWRCDAIRAMMRVTSPIL
jgi:hypothetical protein